MFLYLLSVLLAGFAARQSLQLYRRNVAGAVPADTVFRNHLGLPPRPPAGMARQVLGSQLALLVVLVLGFWLDGWTLAALGVRMVVPVWAALAGGFAVYLGFAALFSLGAYAVGMLARLEDAAFRALRTVWPRDPAEKRLMLIPVCLLNPITEEVVFRGVLVYALGTLVGSHALTVGVGLVLTLLAHTYQGSQALVSHVFFYAVVIGLLFSPLGLLGAIGFHFAGDIVPVATFGYQMRRWVRRRRAGG